MPWVKLTDTFDDDPDLDGLSPEAVCLFVCALTWAARNGTDGFIPEGRVRKLPGGSPKAAKELTAGQKPWWSKEEGGYRVRSFLRYNPSAEDVRTQREKTLQRVSKHRGKRRDKEDYNDGCNAVTEAVTPTVSPPVTDTVSNDVNNGGVTGAPVSRINQESQTTSSIPVGPSPDVPVEIPGDAGFGLDTDPPPKRNAGQERFERTRGVLSLVAASMGWDEPRKADVTRNMATGRAGLQDLLAWLDDRHAAGRLFQPPDDAAAALFVRAHGDWNGAVSWEAVHGKRESLLALIEGRAKVPDRGRSVAAADTRSVDEIAEETIAKARALRASRTTEAVAR